MTVQHASPRLRPAFLGECYFVEGTLDASEAVQELLRCAGDDLMWDQMLAGIERSNPDRLSPEEQAENVAETARFLARLEDNALTGWFVWEDVLPGSPAADVYGLERVPVWADQSEPGAVAGVVLYDE
ncbi:hypothetical protein ACMX2H_16095 [Arthrobacter sulfonylureivorans]|uniref:hypothetical protein n=1 Tax=Arthrobacter sulfonylureivorans TaxID=2486855 RepID=UPI0039E6841C